MSLYVNWDGRTDREIDLPDYDGYYDFLRSGGELPSTSQPSRRRLPGRLRAAGRARRRHPLDPPLRRHLRHGARRRAGARAADRARDGARADGRDRLAHRLRRPRLHVRRRRQRASSGGADLAGAVAAAQAMRENLKIIVMVDTLEYLRRGGRIGAAQAWIGATLKVKPILTIEGEMQPVERVRTAARAFERLVAHLEQRREDGCDGFAIQHVQAPERGRAPGRARARDLRARPGADLGDRPGHRHPHRPGHPRRRPACARICSAPSEGFRARGLETPRGGRPARSSEPP